jgi:hypothetical protein
MKRLIFLGFVILFSRCADHASDSTCGANNSALWSEHATTSIQVGNSVCNNGTGIVFKKVISDSRCPKDANCIWAGEIRIQLQIFSGTDTLVTLELTTREPTAEVTVDQKTYVIEMTRAEPYPMSQHQIDPERYIVTLEVTRKDL